ncbi:restriction endonuclease [Pseudobacillus badius]|uniref:restriction endonuclease n=1 Tax=Bacillus badius TaxID=1455 RepID=UPI003D358459
MNITYHYPPDLFNLLVDTIPLLCKSKRDVLIFFKGAGVPTNMMEDMISKVNFNKDAISKYEIVRTILERINEKGESTLRIRREILRRVTQFENFEACWEKDRLPAKGLVAEISKLIQVKDSFTRMKMEREKEAEKRRKDYLKKVKEQELHRQEIETIKHLLNGLFTYTDPHKRGKELEVVLNRLFKAYGILVREAFVLVGNHGEGIIEQVDGVIELDGELYLVEMKWWRNPIGTGDVSQHLVRIFSRGHSRGIFISNSSFTQPAISMCKESLSRTVMCLCGLDEIVFVLENNLDLKEVLKSKVRAAIIDKNPWLKGYDG